MPTRPNQNSPDQTIKWAARRAVVGARIRVLRAERGISQSGLARESGLSRNMIIGIELGQKSVAYERLWDIAAALGCDVTDLITHTKEGRTG